MADNIKIRSFITGIGGFAGKYLAEFLLKEGHEVFGIDLKIPEPSSPFYVKGATYFKCGLNEYGKLEEFVKQASPQKVFHLAAYARASDSWKNCGLIIDANIKGTVNLLEAVLKEAPDSVIVSVCSGAQYGSNSDIDDQSVFEPLNPYSVSKAAAEHFSLLYSKKRGLDVRVARPFNHTGPLQEKGYVVTDYASEIADAENSGVKKRIKVRSSNVVRNFSDVRDIVRAYVYIAEKGKAGESYNLASDESISVGDIAEILAASAAADVSLEPDGNPPKKETFSVDNSKIKLLGWKPLYRIEETISSVMKFYLEKNI
ncbi:MAG: GDP-mannose 4,6-dehydratase [Fibrobacterota bacterium]